MSETLTREDPHPHYGPCDGFDDGQCSECARIIAALRAALAAERERAEKYRKALEEIAEGRGTYSRDPLTHASNTIDEMKETARAALRGEPA